MPGTNTVNRCGTTWPSSVRTIVALLGETDDVADRFERRRGDLAAHETEVRQSLGRGLAMGGV